MLLDDILKFAEYAHYLSGKVLANADQLKEVVKKTEETFKSEEKK